MAVAGSEGPPAIHPAAAVTKGGNRSWSSTASGPVRFGNRPGDAACGANGIDTLGARPVSTPAAVVLSTVSPRPAIWIIGWVVVRDCCADPDAEVHAIAARHRPSAKQAAVVTHGGVRRRPCLAGLHERTRER